MFNTLMFSKIFTHVLTSINKYKTYDWCLPFW